MPVDMKALLQVARAAISDPGHRKNTHPRSPSRAFYTRMNKNGRSLRRRHIMDYALAAMSQTELYCEAHPGSPSAVRRPRLFVRGELWIALLGPSVEEGIVGIGATVTAALRAFDAQYLAGLRPRRDNRLPPQRSASSISKVGARVTATSLSQLMLHRDTNQGVTRKGITRRENR
jgi:hypothetical protein